MEENYCLSPNSQCKKKRSTRERNASSRKGKESGGACRKEQKRAREARERERERERRRGRRLAERRWRSSDRTMWTSSYVALEKSRNPKKKRALFELSFRFSRVCVLIFFSLQLTRFRFSAAGRVRVQGGQERQGADVSPGGDASPRQEGWSTLSLFFLCFVC